MPRHTKEAIARTIYDENLKDALEPKFNGKAVVIDIESGDYEVAASSAEALFRLEERSPGSAYWALPIGPPEPHEIDALFPPGATPERLMPKNVGDIAEAIYDRLIKDKLGPDSAGKFIAIDIQSGDYEIGDEPVETSSRLRCRRIAAVMWTASIGPDLRAKEHRYGPSKAELEKTGALGKAIYNEKIKPAMEPECNGKVVAIDVKSGDYEIGDDDVQPALRLLERRPDAVIWEQYIGFPDTMDTIPTIVPLGRPL